MARGRLETTVTRRKKGDPAAERVAAAIMEEFSPKTAEEAQEALRSVFGPMIETMLKAELEAHLGYPDNDKGPKDGPNRRNGYTRKVVRTSAGEVPIDVPRDRDATFEPAVVPKGERDLTGIESRVMSMYARGMSQRDIAATVREIYGFSMSAETVSAITDRVWEELERWRSRPLEPVYAFMFVDCLYVPVRRGRGARSMAVYAIVAYDLAGRKDVLGLWMQETEGAHHWMGVFDELRQRGVEDVLFVSMDGVSGLADGLRAIFPDAVAQRCLVHLVRNSCKYVPSKDMQAFCRDARAFYGAPSLSACRAAFADFSEAWARYRYSESDMQRAERQRQLISIIFEEICKMSLSELVSFAMDNIDLVKTNLGISDIISLAPAVLAMRDAEIRELQIPVSGGYKSQTVSGMSVLVPNRQKNANALAEFLKAK